MQAIQYKENIKILEQQVSSAEHYSKDLEKGFVKKLNEAQEEKAKLEKKIQKMDK